MNINTIIKDLHQTEIKKSEIFIKTAEYYKSEPDIYYGCQLMSELSVENSRIAKELGKKLNKDISLFDKYIFSDDQILGNDLGEDLHLLFIKTNLSETNASLVSACIHDHSDLKKESLIFTIQQNLAKQSAWLLNRLKREIEYIIEG